MSETMPTIAYSDLPEKLGVGTSIPVYYRRAEEARVVVEAYLPAGMPDEVYRHCKEQLMTCQMAHAVEITLVADIPSNKQWFVRIPKEDVHAS